VRFLELGQPFEGIGEPAPPAEVAVQARIAIDKDVEPGAVLVGDECGDRIQILLAVVALGHHRRKRSASEVDRERSRPG